MEKDYGKLSRCEFCDEPLGKAQIKKAKAQSSLEADAAMARALEHRDKLLHFDETSAQRTKVFDDQSDYYEMDVDAIDSIWSSEAEKLDASERFELLKQKQDEQSKKRYITFDIAGRKIVEDQALSGTAAGDVYDRLKSALRN